jgi:hypothetical protein
MVQSACGRTRDRSFERLGTTFVFSRGKEYIEEVCNHQHGDFLKNRILSCIMF